MEEVTNNLEAVEVPTDMQVVELPRLVTIHIMYNDGRELVYPNVFLHSYEVWNGSISFQALNSLQVRVNLEDYVVLSLDHQTAVSNEAPKVHNPGSEEDKKGAKLTEAMGFRPQPR